jgi:uncharacterized membrane protein
MSIILLLGIANILLLLFQLFTGMHWIRVKIGLHRKAGVLLVIVAAIHGLIAIVAH